MRDQQADNQRDAQLIVGQWMREFALSWPYSLKDDGDDGLIVLDLAKNQVRDMRVALTRENGEIAVLAKRWLIESGKLKYTRTEDIPVMELTRAGLDFLNSLDAFCRHCRAQPRAEKEKVVPDLDRELAENLGPPFLIWLAINRVRPLAAESGVSGNGS